MNSGMKVRRKDVSRSTRNSATVSWMYSESRSGAPEAMSSVMKDEGVGFREA